MCKKTFKVFKYNDLRIVIFVIGEISKVIDSLLDVYNLDRIETATIEIDRATFLLISKDASFITEKSVICLGRDLNTIKSLDDKITKENLIKLFPELQPLITVVNKKVIEYRRAKYD